MTLLVVVQRICVEWSKEARGGQLATRRAQVPKSFPLPSRNLKLSTSALVQVLNLSELDAFAQPRERLYEYDNLKSSRPAELEMTLEDQTLLILPYSANPTGQVRNVKLQAGETAQYEWNARLVLEHTWRYQHTILNVALTSRPLAGDLFSKQPTYHQSKLVQMY